MTKKMMKSAADKPMDLNEFFGPKPNVVNLQAVNRWDAIDELVDSLVASHKIKPEHREEIWTSLRNRVRRWTSACFNRIRFRTDRRRGPFVQGD
jgi:hypothetical protein